MKLAFIEGELRMIAERFLIPLMKFIFVSLIKTFYMAYSRSFLVKNSNFGQNMAIYGKLKPSDLQRDHPPA